MIQTEPATPIHGFSGWVRFRETKDPGAVLPRMDSVKVEKWVEETFALTPVHAEVKRESDGSYLFEFLANGGKNSSEESGRIFSIIVDSSETEPGFIVSEANVILFGPESTVVPEVRIDNLRVVPRFTGAPFIRIDGWVNRVDGRSPEGMEMSITIRDQTQTAKIGASSGRGKEWFAVLFSNLDRPFVVGDLVVITGPAGRFEFDPATVQQEWVNDGRGWLTVTFTPRSEFAQVLRPGINILGPALETRSGMTLSDYMALFPTESATFIRWDVPSNKFVAISDSSNDPVALLPIRPGEAFIVMGTREAEIKYSGTPWAPAIEFRPGPNIFTVPRLRTHADGRLTGLADIYVQVPWATVGVSYVRGQWVSLGWSDFDGTQPEANRAMVPGFATILVVSNKGEFIYSLRWDGELPGSGLGLMDPDFAASMVRVPEGQGKAAPAARSVSAPVLNLKSMEGLSGRELAARLNAALANQISPSGKLVTAWGKIKKMK